MVPLKGLWLLDGCSACTLFLSNFFHTCWIYKNALSLFLFTFHCFQIRVIPSVIHLIIKSCIYKRMFLFLIILPAHCILVICSWWRRFFLILYLRYMNDNGTKCHLTERLMKGLLFVLLLKGYWKPASCSVVRGHGLQTAACSVIRSRLADSNKTAACSVIRSRLTDHNKTESVQNEYFYRCLLKQHFLHVCYTLWHFINKGLLYWLPNSPYENFAIK